MDKEAQGPPSKKRSIGDMEGDSVSEAAPRLPDLPSMVLVRVFKHVSYDDLRNVRLVHRAWLELVSDNEAELYEARCKALGLLPEGVDTVLGKCAAQTHKRADEVRRNLGIYGRKWWLVAELRDIYRLHYHTWAPHIRRENVPAVLDNRCSRPDSWRWVSCRKALQYLYLEWESKDVWECVVNSDAESLLAKIRSVKCNYGKGRVLYRADDVIREGRYEEDEARDDEDELMSETKY